VAIKKGREKGDRGKKGNDRKGEKGNGAVRRQKFSKVSACEKYHIVFCYLWQVHQNLITKTAL